MDTHIGSSIFQGASVKIDNAGQNLEEEEDLEDQKRRQEEIQSLLTKAMDDFNYDDQSTINSSVNVSTEFGQKYKEAPIESQLEVLYHARVKEVEHLTQQLHELKEQLTNIKGQNLQKLMLAEAENDKLKISLQNSQQSYAEKCNQLEQLTEDKKLILSDIETMQKYLFNLEQEKGALEYNNQNLIEQVAILEKGRAVNPLQDAVIQEKHLQEVTKLQDSLENAICKIQRLEKDNGTLSEKLNSVISEREDLIANKTEVINKLMHSVEQAQAQNHELLCSVNTLKTENEGLKSYMKELENNAQIMKGFSEKTEIIKILQKELDKMKNANTTLSVDCEMLQRQHDDIKKTLDSKNAQIKELQNTIEKESKTTMDCWMQTSKVMDSFSETNLLKGEIVTAKEQLEEKHELINTLKKQIGMLEGDIVNLNEQLTLASRRDNLIDELQAKATKLEEFIVANQRPSTSTDDKATNTASDECELSELYKVKLAAELIEKEIEIRKELQLVYEKNYLALKEKLTRDNKCPRCEALKASEQCLLQYKCIEEADNEKDACTMCVEMSEKLVKNVEKLQQLENVIGQYQVNQEKDREVIVKILEEWQVRFKDLELENEGLKQHLEEAIKSYNTAYNELAVVKSRVHQVAKVEQAKAKAAVDAWSRDTFQKMFVYNETIKKVRSKIDNISLKTDRHVHELEKNFSKAKLEMEVTHK